MKTFLLSLILVSLITLNYRTIFAQSGWQVQDNTFAFYNDVFFLNENTGWVVDEAPGYKILKTTNKGLNWAPIPGIIQECTAIYFHNESTGWLCGNSGRIFRTNNGGLNWIITLTCNCTNADDFKGIQFLNENTGWAFGDLQVFKTTDGGHSYHVQPYYYGGVYTGMFLDSMHGWVAGLFGGGYTTNGGESWIQSDVPGSIPCMSTYFIDLQTGWICSYSGKIFKSTNGGVNWIEQQSGINIPLRKIQFVNENTGWIIGDNGVILRTTNGGMNWSRQTSAAKYNLYGIHMLNPEEGWICGTSCILHTTNGGVTAVSPISTQIPDQFSLSQNYPNPFNPTTKIKFDLPKSSFLTLKIYNSLGKGIETLTNEFLQAGSYESEWNASNYPSGVYYYSITAGNYSETKKMILVK